MSNQETLELMEEGMDAMEATLDVIEATQAAAPSPRSYIFMGVMLAGAAGIGFYVGMKRAELKAEARFQEELAEAREFYRRLNKVDEYETPEKTAEKLVNDEETPVEDILERYQGVKNEEEDPVEEETSNVFAMQADPNFKYEDEVTNRSSGKPYVITEEEYLAQEMSFSQSTLTYYEGDGILADEKDQEVPVIDPIIGEHNLERFGDGTGDEDTMFIRNERMSAEFEVVRSEGKYAHEVLGIQHSDGGNRARIQSSQLKRFRGDPE